MPNQAEPDRSTRDALSKRSLALRVEAEEPSTDLAGVCRFAVEAGFDGVELPAPQLVNHLDLRVAESADRIPTAISTGSVAAIHATCGALDVDRATLEIATSLGWAQRCGARCLNVALPAFARNPAGGQAAGYQASLNLASELLHALRFKAEQAGVTLALEAGVRGTLQSPVELRELVDAANSWAVGACIDVDIVARFGSPEDWIVTLGRRVHAIRVAFHAEGAAPGVVVANGAGDRSLDHGAIVRAIGAIRFKGVLIVAGNGPPKSILAEARRCGYVAAM